MYNPNRDLYPVKPSLSLDLAEAIETGAVSPNGAAPAEHNGFEDTDQIVGRVSDVFGAIEAAHSVSAALSSSLEDSKE